MNFKLKPDSSPILIVEETQRRVFIQNIGCRYIWIGTSPIDNNDGFLLRGGDLLQLDGCNNLYAQCEISTEVNVCFI